MYDSKLWQYWCWKPANQTQHTSYEWHIILWLMATMSSYGDHTAWLNPGFIIRLSKWVRQLPKQTHKEVEKPTAYSSISTCQAISPMKPSIMALTFLEKTCISLWLGGCYGQENVSSLASYFCGAWHKKNKKQCIHLKIMIIHHRGPFCPLAPRTGARLPIC